MVAAAAWNKSAPARLLLADLAAGGADLLSVVSNRGGRTGGGRREIVFVLGPRRCGGVRFGVVVRIWSFLRGELQTMEPRLLLRVFLCRSGRWFMVRLAKLPARRGAVPPPIWLHRLDPGCRVGCSLRRTQRGLLLYSFTLAILLGLVSLAGVPAAEVIATEGSVQTRSRGLSCYFLIVQGLLCKFGAAGPCVSCAST